jgi:hypothetical protein
MKTLNLKALLTDNLIEVIGTVTLVRLAKAIPSIGPSIWVGLGLVAVVIAIVIVLDDWVSQGYKFTNLFLVGLLIVHSVSIIFGLLVGWFV